ncbi:MAG: GTPase Era [Ilumatobacteraceae bacterium]
MVGRPNVGKSSLVNALCGGKVSIVSDKPQTARHRVRGVLTRDGAQLVFVDTPGLHKAVTALGERVSATALASVDDVDVTCLVLDATAPFGGGDRWVAARLRPATTVVVVNKIDRASTDQVARMLAAASELDAAAYVPVSARTGDGLDLLLDELVSRAPEGPQFFPAETVRDVPDEQWVAELVREQLLAVTRDELPYSIATRVAEWEWPRIRVEIIVERESQKPMVIGKGGSVLKRVGQLARQQMPEGVYLELRVKVDKNWQHRADRVERPRLLRSSGDQSSSATSEAKSSNDSGSPGSLTPSWSGMSTGIGSPSRLNVTWPMPGRRVSVRTSWATASDWSLPSSWRKTSPRMSTRAMPSSSTTEPTSVGSTNVASSGLGAGPPGSIGGPTASESTTTGGAAGLPSSTSADRNCSPSTKNRSTRSVRINVTDGRGPICRTVVVVTDPSEIGLVVVVVVLTTPMNGPSPGRAGRSRSRSAHRRR